MCLSMARQARLVEVAMSMVGMMVCSALLHRQLPQPQPVLASYAMAVYMLVDLVYMYEQMAWMICQHSVGQC